MFQTSSWRADSNLYVPGVGNFPAYQAGWLTDTKNRTPTPAALMVYVQYDFLQATLIHSEGWKKNKNPFLSRCLWPKAFLTQKGEKQFIFIMPFPNLQVKPDHFCCFLQHSSESSVAVFCSLARSASSWKKLCLPKQHMVLWGWWFKVPELI